jgi:hypothetical protein
MGESRTTRKPEWRWTFADKAEFMNMAEGSLEEWRCNLILANGLN